MNDQRMTHRRPEPLADLRGMLEARRGQIQKFVGTMMDPERIVSLALLACAKNDALLRCSKESVIQAVYDAARLNLEPDGVQGAIVPFGSTATFMPMYQGLLSVAYEDEAVQAIDARAVHDGDHFRVVLGTEEGLEHRPDRDADRANPVSLTDVYAIARIRGVTKFEWMTRAEVDAIRMRSPSVKRGKSSPWDTDYIEMAKKTVLRRLTKTLPKRSRRLREVLAHDDDIHRREEDMIDMPPAPQAPEAENRTDARRTKINQAARPAQVATGMPADAEIEALYRHLGIDDPSDQDRFAKFPLRLVAEQDWRTLDAAQKATLLAALKADAAAMEEAAKGADET